MKTTYESCGRIDVANKTVTVATYLPDLNINFRYVHFYNISTPTHYGVLGILVNDGINHNFSKFPAIKKFIPGTIHLNNLDTKFSNIPFDQLTDKSEIGFYCLHDDRFNFESPTLEDLECIEVAKRKIEFLVKPRNTETKIDATKTKKGDDEPKVGNGGVLTVTGSC